MSEIIVSSTTDSQADVNRAAGIEEPASSTTSDAAENKAAETAAGSDPALESTDHEGKDKEKPSSDSWEKEKKKLLRRIDKLTGEKYDLRDRLKELEDSPSAARQVRTETQAVQASDKPVPDKFSTYEEYVEALADWKADQRVKSALAEREQSQQQETESQRLEKIYSAYNERVAEAHARYDDFEDVVGNPKLVLPKAAIMAAFEVENGPDVAYYLATHDEEREKLLAMSDIRAVAEIGRISDRLLGEADKSKPSKGSPTRTSAAPPPIKPVSGGSTRSAVPLDELDYQAYKKARAQGRTS